MLQKIERTPEAGFPLQLMNINTTQHPMTAEEFVRAVEEIEPGKEEFVESVRGTYSTPTTLEHTLRTYYFRRRFVLYAESNGDPIIDLMTNYDVSDFNCCGFSFYDEAKPSGDVIPFGAWGPPEGMLVINTHSGEIELHDYGSDKLLYRCALNSSSFLAALYELIEMSKRRSVGELTDFENEAEDVYKHRCIDRAGGYMYAMFYKVLFEGDDMIIIR